MMTKIWRHRCHQSVLMRSCDHYIGTKRNIWPRAVSKSRKRVARLIKRIILIPSFDRTQKFWYVRFQTPFWRNFRDFSSNLFFDHCDVIFCHENWHGDSWYQELSEVCQNFLTIPSNKKNTEFRKWRMSLWNTFFFENANFKASFLENHKYFWTRF